MGDEPGYPIRYLIDGNGDEYVDPEGEWMRASDVDGWSKPWLCYLDVNGQSGAILGRCPGLARPRSW